MVSRAPPVLDHVLNPDHDALAHSAVFSGFEGNLYCVHCAADRYENAPNFRRLALLEGIRCILQAHGPHCLRSGMGACVDMLLHGIDSAETGVVQAATDILLVLKGELPDPVHVLASLVSRTLSLGLPRASGHLYLIGQLLANASHDRALATALGNACMGRDGVRPGNSGIADGDRAEEGIGRQFRGFAAFLAANAVSASCPDHIKSDVMYVAMELLDCCTMASVDLGNSSQELQRTLDGGIYPPLPAPEDDPFVGVMLAVPRLLGHRSACDEPLQLHSVAYLATAAAYCIQRTEMGTPGWSTNAAGVPGVLVDIFGGSGSKGHHELAPHDTVAGGNSAHHSSSGSLCSTLKALLMSSSYRVRSATARLLDTLCNDSSPSGDHGVDEGIMSGTKEIGLFFRETLIAAGTTDFLFEAIKAEREGTVRHYLEAAEAFALSPIEFFHAANFSMKFAAPILLGASRGQEDVVGSGSYRDDTENRMDCSDEENEAKVFTSSCRLLLQALVSVPPSSSAGVVEELLTTAAVTTQSDNSRNRAIGVAADVLSLVASDEISLAKDQGSFIDAVGVLLDRLEDHIVCPDRSESPPAGMPIPFGGKPSPIVPGDQPQLGTSPGEDHDGDCGLILQVARVMESLFHMAEEWIRLPGDTQLFQVGKRSKASGDGAGRDALEGGVALAELVFGAYERTLSYQHDLISRSDNITHAIAFVSCMGASVDAASAVLHKRWEEAAARNTSVDARLHVKPYFVEVSDLANLHRGSQSFAGAQNAGSCHASDRGKHQAPEELALAPTDNTDPALAASASCMETILMTTVESDVISWMLNLYTQCGGARSSSSRTPRHNMERNVEGVPEDVTSQHLRGPNDDMECCSTTRELLAEVLQSLLYAQGWVNGLCAHDADGPLHMRKGPVGSGGDGGVCGDNMEGELLTSSFGETVRSVLKSWTSNVACDGEAVPFDHYAMSLLGTSADNGDLWKLVVLLISLSSTYLGVLHPHPGCRVDSVVTLLRFAKTVPEAVFSLNMFSYISLTCGNSPASPTGVDRVLAAAIKDVLARFPVADLAVSYIPLSAMALSFAARAGCVVFVADWLVALPLGRVKGILLELGLPGGRESVDDTGTMAEGNTGRIYGEGDWSVADGPTDGCDLKALTGVLEAVVSRWAAELGNGLQHSQAEATILQLSSLLLLSPDTFLCLAFDSGGCGNGPRDRKDTVEAATPLGAVVSDTLWELSKALSSVLLRRSDDSTNDRASKIACAFQAFQLASAFLRARCLRGYYSPVHGETYLITTMRVSHQRPRFLEAALARSCGGLLQGILDPRRGHRSSGKTWQDEDVSINATLFSALNLLNSLLVLLGGRWALVQNATEELRAALREAHDVLSEVLDVPAMAVDRLRGWLDHAPETLAAFLQTCTIWNVIESRNSARNYRNPGYKRIDPPFEVLAEILSLGNSGLFHVGVVVGIERSSKQVQSRRRGVRRSLLQVLAARCVESAAPTKQFSREEVLTLQLALQGIACDGGATLACAALKAIQALWESYTELLQPNDLAGQSWHSFVVESCLETAMRLLARDGSRTVARQAKDRITGVCAEVYSRNIPEGFSEDAPVLVSAIANMLRWSAGKKYPRLRTSVISDGGDIELLSAKAIVYIHQCITLLATHLHTALETDTTESAVGQGSTAREGGCDDGLSGGIRSSLVDSLSQLVVVLTCMEPPSQNSIVAESVRQEVLGALTLLDSMLTQLDSTFGSVLAGSRGTASDSVEGALPLVAMPLSKGASYDSCVDSDAVNYSEGIFVVKCEHWRALSSTSDSCSRVVELNVKIKKAVEILSQGSRTPIADG